MLQKYRFLLYAGLKKRPSLLFVVAKRAAVVGVLAATLTVACASLPDASLENLSQTLEVQNPDVISADASDNNVVIIPTEENSTTAVAIVEEIKVSVATEARTRVDVHAAGTLPDGCTEVSHTEQLRQDKQIKLTIYTTRLAQLECAETRTPWASVIPVDVHGLSADTYTLVVNGVTSSLDLTNLVWD